MKFVKTVLAASLAMVLAAQAQAVVSTQDPAKLGTSLTLVGAEKSGNADGSIPAYSGGLTTAPAGFKAGDSMHSLLWELIPNLVEKYAPNHRGEISPALASLHAKTAETEEPDSVAGNVEH